MQLSATSSALLTSVLLALTSQEVLAAPFQGPGANTITLSLGRREPSQSLHPQIELQRRMNTNQRRMAQIARRAPPTDAQLKANMDARVASVVAAGGSVTPGNSTPAVPPATGAGAGAINSTLPAASSSTPPTDPLAASSSLAASGTTPLAAGSSAGSPAAPSSAAPSAPASSAAPSAPASDAASSAAASSAAASASASVAIPSAPASGAVPSSPASDAIPSAPASGGLPSAPASGAIPPPVDPAAAASTPVPGRFASPALQAALSASGPSATPSVGGAPVPQPPSQPGGSQPPAAATNSSAVADVLSNPAVAASLAGSGGAYLVLPGAMLKKAGFKASAGPDGHLRLHRHKKSSGLGGRVRLHKQKKHSALAGHRLNQHDNDDGGDDGNASGSDSEGQSGGSDNASSSSSDSEDDSTLPGPVEQVTNSTTPSEPDSLAVDIEAQDLGYFITVQIGTPPQPFRVTIDSGSSDFWVEGSGCKAKDGDACASDHAFISETTSSTFVNTNESWNITYGSGAVSGDIVRDNVVIDGLSLPNHTFGTANRETSDFSAFAIPYDGLMGLGLSVGSDQGVPNPVDALASAGLIKDSITSYKISRVADGKHDGEITFGGMDPSKFQPSTLVTLPVVSQDGFWETALDAAGVANGGSIPSGKRTAIHDTGTTGIIAPVKDAEALHKLIPGAKADGQGGYTVPCNTNASVTLTFGGKTFPIDPRDLSEFGPVNNNDPDGDCVSAISGDTGGDDGAQQWLLGDTFLKNVYFSTRSTGSSSGYVSLAQLS